MKEEAPLGNPLIGESRGGRSTKGGGRTATPCGHRLSMKREKEGCDGWPAGQALASIFLYLSSSTTS
jgi:hypothetical protein